MSSNELECFIKDHLKDKLGHLRAGSRRDKTYETMSDYVKGLLSTASRKNSWQLSEKLGAFTPYRFQHLLYDVVLDVPSLQTELMAMTIEELGKSGILTFDDTGFLKKGDQSAGVQRQYTGTAGRVENSQVGTFMGYKTERGHSLLDARLYIPESWTNDRERCKKAKIPDDFIFEKKALHAAHMYEAFKKKGYTCSWVTADEAYGKDPDFIKVLEEAKQPYVVAVSKDYSVRCGDLKQKLPAEKWIEKEEAHRWRRLSAGLGSKGERLYNWLLIKRSELNTPEGYERFLLCRQSITTGEQAYYSVFAPLQTSIEKLVSVAGSRWSIEECFEMAKGETGLDQYEVRSYPGWQRHIILSMWALFILVSLKNKMNEHEFHLFQDFLNDKKEEPELRDRSNTQSQNQEAETGQEVQSSENAMEEYKKKRKLSDLQFKKLRVL